MIKQANMGTADRAIRMVIALIFAALILTGTVTGILVWILGLFAVIFVVTSFISFCPLYLPFKFSTKK
jgi:hypothetical protein